MAQLTDQINHLDSVLLNRYRQKLSSGYDTGRTERVDDVSKSPSVDYGCIYTYVINTPRMYTAEILKSYRSVDSYAPHHAALVPTVVYHACIWCIMHVTADILNIP